MTPWNQRPIEIANLFNPAFCSILIADAISSYIDDGGSNFDYPLSFLILPIILHKATRDNLPSKITTKMHVWLQEKPEFRIDFAKNTRYLVPYTREALIYGVNSGIVNISDKGSLIRSDVTIKKPKWPKDSEPSLILRKATFVGRWFARSGNTSTIYAMWGIQP